MKKEDDQKAIPATMAFESMKGLLEEAIGKSGAHVDSQTKEALNKNLQKVFCDTFGATEPSSKPSDGGSLPQNEAHSHNYIWIQYQFINIYIYIYINIYHVMVIVIRFQYCWLAG